MERVIICILGLCVGFFGYTTYKQKKFNDKVIDIITLQTEIDSLQNNHIKKLYERN